MLKALSLSLLVFLGSITLLSSQDNKFSVFAEGDVYKLELDRTGIYKITYDNLKTDFELDPDNINPKNIHIYGNNGGLLEQVNQASMITDLRDNAIYVEGEADGRFDTDDYILFYAEGADRWKSSSQGLTYEKNVYDQYNYCYLKITDSPGPRVQTVTSVETGTYDNNTDVVVRHELDKENLLASNPATQGSGKKWFGEVFASSTEISFNNELEVRNLDLNYPVTVKMAFAARGPENSRVSLNFNGESFSQQLNDVNLADVEGLYASETFIEEELELTSQPDVSVSYNANSTTSFGWLDYIQLSGKANNIYNSTPLYLYTSEANSSSTHGFSVSNTPSDLLLWNITGDETTQIQYKSESSSLSFGYETSDIMETFILFDKNGTYDSPQFISQVENQNLHAIERADYVIVYFSAFQEAANKLAEHRRNTDAMVVEEVNINDIYEEFGSGRKDITALRNFARFVYERDSSFKYLLLLGDASYDFRGINTQIEYQNFIPTYQTDNSLYPINAFPSDDYFGLLDEGEGNDNMDGDLDIGIGRIPAKTAREAMIVVDKIIHYDTNPDRFGDWRARIGFAADDEDKSQDKAHIRDADGISVTSAEDYPCFHQQKVYFDAFKQEATPGGQRYPLANSSLKDNFNQGQLVFNYLGHGGPKGLSQERVMQVTDIINWENYDNLPVFVTATCSFTGFDEPTVVSAGEHAILSPIGGAVALYTTVRSVFSSHNKALTEDIFNNIFERKEGKAQRLGDIIRLAKNNSSTSASERRNTRKFLLIGDPAMRIGMPEHNIEVTNFNRNTVNMSQDTIGALDRVTVAGQVTSHASGDLISDFNGKINITVFDKPSQLKSLNNDGVGNPFEFEVEKNVLYKGSATVVNGEFMIDFILPQDINFDYGNGSLHFYASNQVTDGFGCYDDFVIGGASINGIVDDEGPEINIFFDDRSFVSGDKTNIRTELIIDLSDESGINLSSTSIGHDITYALEDDNKVVLNDFFVPGQDELGSGTVIYPLSDLSLGMHRISVTAWDILNNSSTVESEFLVVNSVEDLLSQVSNYPNPITNFTNFRFNHDLGNNNLDISISIFTLSGQLVKTIETESFSSGSQVDDINWDVNDNNTGRLANGIYVYKIKATSSQLNVSQESDFEKMVIIN